MRRGCDAPGSSVGPLSLFNLNATDERGVFCPRGRSQNACELRYLKQRSVVAEQGPSAVLVNFQLAGDHFLQAWFFNRFRVDSFGSSKLVTAGLVADSGIIAVNAFVIPDTDLRNSREQSLKFLGEVAIESAAPASYNLSFSSPPARVYPVNHLNLSRIDQTGELGLYRHSVHSLVSQMRDARDSGKTPVVTAYPVVLFRTELPVLLALLKELYTG
jgi:hypothetical protein